MSFSSPSISLIFTPLGQIGSRGLSAGDDRLQEHLGFRFLEGNQVCVVSDPDDEYPLARIHLLVRVLKYLQQVSLVYMEGKITSSKPTPLCSCRSRFLSSFQEKRGTPTLYHLREYAVPGDGLSCSSMCEPVPKSDVATSLGQRCLPHEVACSNCLDSQEEIAATFGVRSRQVERCLSMELRVTSSFLMQAVRAGFLGLPAASRRW